MIYKEKQKLFNNFSSKWQKPFSLIPHLLEYISSYPSIISKFKDYIPLSANELNESQLEWISLVAQFDNPIETSFFKDYWVPIQKNGYDYFIDISSDKFPIFEVHYFFFEPYRWYKEYVIDDVITFLSIVDNENFNVDEYFQKHKKESWAKVQDFFKERKELGLSD
ncbi:MAG: hypothetical protein AB7E36_12880 [Salinivirgaceae bacterium]